MINLGRKSTDKASLGAAGACSPAQIADAQEAEGDQHSDDSVNQEGEEIDMPKLHDAAQRRRTGRRDTAITMPERPEGLGKPAGYRP